MPVGAPWHDAGVIVFRVGRFLTTGARHGLPIGGIIGGTWHPVTAIGVYWVESVLLVLSVALLSALLQRRTSDAAIHAARLEGDDEAVRALERQRTELNAAGIRPRDLLAFHLGSLGVFGGFFGGIIVLLIGNGHLAEPIRWGELGQGVAAMLAIVAVALTVDLWAFDRLTVPQLSARVSACLTRWGLFWLLGFAGSIMMTVSGRPMVFFGFFAVLKVTFETWAGLARLFGWRSLKEREAAGRA